MSRPVVALLTDFGTSDHYSGVMKGVVLDICPDANVVDIAHDVPPHDVNTASLELAASYKYFPSGTVFLVVVDPGVGSDRRALAADIGNYRFVAPDNGVRKRTVKDSPASILDCTSLSERSRHNPGYRYVLVSSRILFSSFSVAKQR